MLIMYKGGSIIQDIEKKIKGIRDSGDLVYSISRLNAFHSCPYNFYLTYVKGNRDDRVENIYSFAGSMIHGILDRIYSKNKTYNIDDIEREFKDFMMECNIYGFRFPTEKTERNWLDSMKHFVANYKPLQPYDSKSEERILWNLDGIWLQGYIDYQAIHKDGSMDIIDWKTSSKFTGKKLKEAGRQLLIYKLAKEAEGCEINRVGWYMIKYLNISYPLKNGKTKTSMYQRGQWVQKLSKTLEKMLNDYTYEKACKQVVNDYREEIEPIKDRKLSNRLEANDAIGAVETLAERYSDDVDWLGLVESYGHNTTHNSLLVEESIMDNSIENLPLNFQKMFKIEDCLVWYDYTEEDIAEVKDYIETTVETIKNKDWDDPMDWEPTGIMDNKFYCQYLCGQRGVCPYSLDEEIKKESVLPF